MHRVMRLSATAGVTAVLGLMAPASAWASPAEGNERTVPGPQWVSVELWDLQQDCTNAAREYMDNGTYAHASCTRARKGSAEAWVLWAWQ